MKRHEMLELYEFIPFFILLGESDDDHEELLAAASYASSASCMASIPSYFG